MVETDTVLEYKYRAFISYSSADRPIAERFQNSLERFKVPSVLRGRETKMGRVRKRLIPIFRDRSDLEVHADMSSRINEALSESAALVVLCSEHSARSKWVNQEIETFHRLGRADRIFLVILDGEPALFPKGVFPPAISPYDEGAGADTESYIAPLAVDVRPEGDGWQGATEKVIASLLGVSLTELKDRLFVAERREKFLARSIATVMTAVSIVAIVALWQAIDREQKRFESNARFLAEKSFQISSDHDHARAARFALEGLPAEKKWLLRPQIVPEAEGALVNAIQQNRLVSVYKGHEKLVATATFNPDGSIIASASDDKSIAIWDRVSGDLLARIETHTQSVNTVEFSPDGDRIVSTDWAGEARIHRWRTESDPIILDHGDQQVWSAQFHPNRPWVATAANDGAVRLWSSETGDLLSETAAHSISVNYLSFSPNGTSIATGSSDHSIKIWSIADEPQLELANTIRGHTDWVTSVRYSPDGKLLASSSDDSTLRLWHSDTGEQLAIFEGHEGPTTSVSFSPDGEKLASTGADKTVRLWKINSPETPTVLAGHQDVTWSARFSPNHDDAIVVSSSTDATLRIWSAIERIEINAVPELENLRFATFLRNGNAVVGTSEDNEIRFLDLLEGGASKTFALPSKPTTLIGFHDGSRFLIGDSQGDVLTLQIAPNGEPKVISNVSVADSPITHLNVASDDATTLIGTASGRAIVYDSTSNEIRHDLEKHGDIVLSSAFDFQTNRLITGSKDNDIRVWNVLTGELEKVLGQHDADVMALAFSKDGRRFFSASRATNSIAWSAETLEPIATYRAHADVVTSIALVGTTGTAITVDLGGAIHAWNQSTGATQMVVSPVEQSPTALTYNPETQKIIALYSDGHLVRFDFPLERGIELLNAVCGRMAGQTARWALPKAARYHNSADIETYRFDARPICERTGLLPIGISQ